MDPCSAVRVYAINIIQPNTTVFLTNRCSEGISFCKKNVFRWQTHAAFCIVEAKEALLRDCTACVLKRKVEMVPRQQRVTTSSAHLL